jgi:hypothetical protein
VITLYTTGGVKGRRWETQKKKNNVEEEEGGVVRMCTLLSKKPIEHPASRFFRVAAVVFGQKNKVKQFEP